MSWGFTRSAVARIDLPRRLAVGPTMPTMGGQWEKTFFERQQGHSIYNGAQMDSSFYSLRFTEDRNCGECGWHHEAVGRQIVIHG